MGVASFVKRSPGAWCWLLVICMKFYLQYQKVTEKAKGYLFEKVQIHQCKSQSRVILKIIAQ
jgi:hypothetical protein